MKTRLLLITTAVFEFTTGVALMLFPSVTVQFLLGSPFDSAPEVVVSRIAGAALIALSVACWMSRHDKGSVAATGLITGMFLYNIMAAVILVYAGFILQLSVVLLLTIIIHLGLTAWCVFVLQYVRRNKR